MSHEITLVQLKRWLLAYADRIAEHQVYLSELDAAIGDADHGANMHRGMSKVRERLLAGDEACHDVGSLLRTVAMTLISSVGGAAGPLYGAFFLRAALNTNGSSAVTLEQLTRMFRSGLEGVQQRGKAQLHEKTMIDAMQPAVQALEDAIRAGASTARALDQARAAAELGMRHTVNMQATKGRASYLGVRSIGHQDPGATSTFYLFDAAAAVLAAAGQEAAPQSAPQSAPQAALAAVPRTQGNGNGS
jgi:dihydroxyacetone kinase-like protein